jgi:hypothetical protein
MKHFQRNLINFLAAAWVAVLCLHVPLAKAQGSDYPSRSVKMVVGFPPGGGTFRAPWLAGPALGSQNLGGQSLSLAWVARDWAKSRPQAQSGAASRWVARPALGGPRACALRLAPC